jgi:hypothetical protein
MTKERKVVVVEGETKRDLHSEGEWEVPYRWFVNGREDKALGELYVTAPDRLAAIKEAHEICRDWMKDAPAGETRMIVLWGEEFSYLGKEPEGVDK